MQITFKIDYKGEWIKTRVGQRYGVRWPLKVKAKRTSALIQL